MPRCEMCDEWLDCPWKTDPEIICGEYRPKPMTNYDCIRQMSVEELADMFVDIGECDKRCPAKVGDCIFSDSSCRSAWLDWLKSQVEIDK